VNETRSVARSNGFFRLESLERMTLLRIRVWSSVNLFYFIDTLPFGHARSACESFRIHRRPFASTYPLWKTSYIARPYGTDSMIGKLPTRRIRRPSCDVRSVSTSFEHQHTRARRQSSFRIRPVIRNLRAPSSPVFPQYSRSSLNVSRSAISASRIRGHSSPASGPPYR